MLANKMSSSSSNKPRSRRRLPSLPQASSRHQHYELQQRQQSPTTKIDVERLSKLPPHILKQLKTVENDPAILTAKVSPYSLGEGANNDKKMSAYPFKLGGRFKR